MEELKHYAAEINLPNGEADKFFDHFTSTGWRIGGKSPMRDWKAALRNWQRRQQAFTPQTKGMPTPQWADAQRARKQHALELRRKIELLFAEPNIRWEQLVNNPDYQAARKELDAIGPAVGIYPSDPPKSLWQPTIIT